MSAERPSILQIKNDVIQIALPYVAGTEETYLTADAAAGATSFTVKDNVGLAQNEYLIFGAIGTEQAEVKRITGAVSAGSALTVAATTFAHPAGTKVTRIRYDQVELYRSTSASDAAPTLTGSATALDVTLGYNEILASTTSTYYYARYKDSNAGTYSSYSDAAIATGLSSQSRAEIKKEFLSIYNERVDDLITDDWLNRAINRWQRELEKRKKQWSFLRASTNLTTLVQDQQGYTLPTDMKDLDTRSAIISVKIKDEPELTYVDQRIFLSLTSNYIGTTLAANIALVDTSFTLTSSKDFAAPSSGTASIYIQGDTITYTTNTKSTNVLSGGAAVTATHTSGDEVWQVYTSGQPTRYTIDNGKVKLYPIPNSSWANTNLYVEYWKKFADLVDDSDETLCIWPENCYRFLDWQLSIRRKLPLNDQQFREAEWKGDLEHLASDDADSRDVRFDVHNMYQSIY